MKKQYIQPEFDIILLTVKSQILAGSQDTPVTSIATGTGSANNGDAYGHDDDYDW